MGHLSFQDDVGDEKKRGCNCLERCSIVEMRMMACKEREEMGIYPQMLLKYIGYYPLLRSWYNLLECHIHSHKKEND